MPLKFDVLGLLFLYSLMLWVFVMSLQIDALGVVCMYRLMCWACYAFTD
jgi:hypothetical protein